MILWFRDTSCRCPFNRTASSLYIPGKTFICTHLNFSELVFLWHSPSENNNNNSSSSSNNSNNNDTSMCMSERVPKGSSRNLTSVFPCRADGEHCSAVPKNSPGTQFSKNASSCVISKRLKHPYRDIKQTTEHTPLSLASSTLKKLLIIRSTHPRAEPIPVTNISRRAPALSILQTSFLSIRK